MGSVFQAECECGYEARFKEGRGMIMNKSYYICLCNTCNSMFSDNFYTTERQEEQLIYTQMDVVCKYCKSNDLSYLETPISSSVRYLCPQCDRYSLELNAKILWD
jgi:hypothetical protein